MNSILLYLIEVNLALSLFYLLYRVLLRKDTFFRIRRLFLLSAIVFSLLYPFATIPVPSGFSVLNFNPSADQTTISIGEPKLVAVVPDEAEEWSSITWEQIGMWIYVAVVLFFCFRFLGRLFSIFLKMKRAKRVMLYGVPVFRSNEKITPFSFFKFILIPVHDYSEKELRQILLHEHTHVRQWHSVDILLIELVTLFSWWNPFVWRMKREISLNLEYLADQEVLKNGIDSRDYQYHLLKLTYHETAVQIVNNFNVSQLKQRIMMMNKSKTSVLKLTKYLLVLPLAFLLLFANSCMNKTAVEDDHFEENEVATSEETDSDPSLRGSEFDKEEEVFVVVDNQPEFPGGTGALMKYLGDSIRYPVVARENGIQGKVICNFVVGKDGLLRDFEIVRSADPILDQEALRVLKLMPKWKPGTQKGVAVNVRYTLPVIFRLDDDETNSARLQASTEKLSESDSDEVFVVVDTQPEFPGGSSAMMRWISDNVKYPAEAIDKKKEGRVIVNFIVEKDGDIDDVRVIRGVDEALDREAVRLVESMPKWKPGAQKGQIVRVNFVLPVVFRLSN